VDNRLLRLCASDFKKLKVWRKAHALALNVHAVAIQIRGADNASLRNQLLRAAQSVPTNIVEGTGHTSGKEFGRFLSIALKSTSELEYHLIFGREIRVISLNDFESLSAQAIEVRKMLHGLRNRVAVSPEPARRDVPTS
jgi:four helix bundle protein